MKIGIIETGKPSKTLMEKYGDYPSMFENLLQTPGNNFEFFTVSIVSGQVLPDIKAADGWLITGSRHGAYDSLDWILNLKDFVKSCADNKIPMLGICFGHQIIASALGGKVEKSNKGWAVGPNKYHFSNKPAWISEINESYSSHAIHQDQIVETAPGSTVIASSSFCEFAAIIYGDYDFPFALTIQSHPELSAGFVKDISAERLAQIVPKDVLQSGLKKLGAPVHNDEWGTIFSNFFRQREKPNTG